MGEFEWLEKNQLGRLEQSHCPKEMDGLEIGSLKALNTILVVKWWWHLKSEPSSLWNRAIVGIHNLQSKPIDLLFQ